jgi:hypothetical protein
MSNALINQNGELNNADLTDHELEKATAAAWGDYSFLTAFDSVSPLLRRICERAVLYNCHRTWLSG